MTKEYDDLVNQIQRIRNMCTILEGDHVQLYMDPMAEKDKKPGKYLIPIEDKIKKIMITALKDYAAHGLPYE